MRINENELMWLKGMLAMESDKIYEHSNEERKIMKKILKKLREIK